MSALQHGACRQSLDSDLIKYLWWTIQLNAIMAEPQPSNITEGADAPDVLPANAEDRKAAQAMSSLDIKEARTMPRRRRR